MKKRKIRKAFTIVELLLALTISALLFTAVGFALQASMANYTANESLSRNLNKARQALIRITNDLRTAQAVSASDLANQCSVITAAGKDITYSYDSQSGKLYLITNYNLTDKDFLLCDGIESLTFTKQTALNGSGLTCVKSVQIKITVKDGSDLQTLAAASVVRKNL